MSIENFTNFKIETKQNHNQRNENNQILRIKNEIRIQMFLLFLYKRLNLRLWQIMKQGNSNFKL